MGKKHASVPGMRKQKRPPLTYEEAVKIYQQIPTARLKSMADEPVPTLDKVARLRRSMALTELRRRYG